MSEQLMMKYDVALRHQRAGDFSKAIECFQELLETAEIKQIIYHPEQNGSQLQLLAFASLKNLASILRKENKPEEALDVYSKVSFLSLSESMPDTFPRLFRSTERIR